jgi:hypothetical protein
MGVSFADYTVKVQPFSVIEVKTNTELLFGQDKVWKSRTQHEPLIRG